MPRMSRLHIVCASKAWVGSSRPRPHLENCSTTVQLGPTKTQRRQMTKMGATGDSNDEYLVLP